jgi:hypothetical protein
VIVNGYTARSSARRWLLSRSECRRLAWLSPLIRALSAGPRALQGLRFLLPIPSIFAAYHLRSNVPAPAVWECGRPAWVSFPVIPGSKADSESLPRAINSAALRRRKTAGAREQRPWRHRVGAELGEPQMVGVYGASPADQTRLRRHELQVGFVAEPTRLADRKHALVDFAGGGFGLNVC